MLFLTQICKVNPLVKDRWDHIPSSCHPFHLPHSVIVIATARSLPASLTNLAHSSCKRLLSPSAFFPRWGNSPLDDALQFSRDDVVKILQEYEALYTETNTSCPTEPEVDPEEQQKLDALKGLVWWHGGPRHSGCDPSQAPNHSLSYWRAGWLEPFNWSI